jgi:hypothetical protein
MRFGIDLCEGPTAAKRHLDTKGDGAHGVVGGVLDDGTRVRSNGCGAINASRWVWGDSECDQSIEIIDGSDIMFSAMMFGSLSQPDKWVTRPGRRKTKAQHYCSVCGETGYLSQAVLNSYHRPRGI